MEMEICIDRVFSRYQVYLLLMLNLSSDGLFKIFQKIFIQYYMHSDVCSKIKTSAMLYFTRIEMFIVCFLHRLS